MRAASFFLLACACLISGLSASFIDFPLQNEKSNFDDLEGKNFIPQEESNPEVQNFYPTRPYPSSTTTTTTTTSRPVPPTRPPSPPVPPSTPRPRPELKNAQIYDNAVLALGPFAGNLINVVANQGGTQKTIQKNEILYNLKFLKPNRGILAKKSDD